VRNGKCARVPAAGAGPAVFPAGRVPAALLQRATFMRRSLERASRMPRARTAQSRPEIAAVGEPANNDRRYVRLMPVRG
jgi:hypothetical protein